MSMGNYFRGRCVLGSMATNQRRTGIDHLTVVPENFEPPEDEDEDDAEASAESGRSDA
jgi:hypothetical protein